MSFSLRFLPTLLLACFFGLTLSVFAQSTAQTNKVPRGAITGRITIKDKGAAGIVIGVRKSARPSGQINSEPFAKAVTDQDGRYRISNLAAGSYEVIPSAPAFVIGGPNFPRSKAVIVGDDETIDDINFSLVRGGVITGRVTDSEGRLAIQQGLQVYQVTTGTPDQQLQRPLQPVQGAATDDRGIYRVFGLVPGRYMIAAGKGEGAFAPPGPPGRYVYSQVFYPDATNQEKAKIIEVAEGGEAKDIDIILGRALQTFSANGRVVDDKDVSVANLQFGLQRGVGRDTEFVNSMALTNSQGDFTVEGLVPGKYSLFLFPNQGHEARVQTAGFEIIDQDVTGITIKLSKGGSMSGVAVIETEDKTALEKLKTFRLSAYASMGGGGFGGTASSPISPDGSFRLGGLHGGTVMIFLGSVNSPSPVAGFQISRIERDGVTLPRNIEIKDGEDITGLRVFITYGTATLRGVVKLENGTLPEGAQIFVRLNKAGETASYGRPAQADARGHFVIEALAPGVYELSAHLYGPGDLPPRVSKREINVQEGVANEVLITIDMSAPASPQKSP